MFEKPAFGNLSCYWVTLRKINFGKQKIDITFVDCLFLASFLQGSFCELNVRTITSYGCSLLYLTTTDITV